jgi:septal ring factor EnvC (AmiA/AmiB activator)
MNDLEPTLGPNDWWQKGLLAVIATLSSLVAFFYRKLESNNREAITNLQLNLAKQEARSEQCEKDRLELFRTQVEQQTKIAALEEQIKEIKPSRAT